MKKDTFIMRYKPSVSQPVLVGLPKVCIGYKQVMGKFNRHKPNGQMTREPPQIQNDS